MYNLKGIIRNFKKQTKDPEYFQKDEKPNKRVEFCNRIARRGEDIVSETGNHITISCCEGRMIRCLNKHENKPYVAVKILPDESELSENDR